MNFHFEYLREESWPALAWIAECIESQPVIRIRHGPQVEVREKWFCEAVWDGEFEAGDFDRTDLIFGSGARLREGRVMFVSSGSTVDRLQFLRLEGRVLVSNSLACLLAVGGSRVDPAYSDYKSFFDSIARGIDDYERCLPTESGQVELVYFRNLSWDGRHLAEEDKPEPTRDFSSFAGYRDFLKSALKGIAENMADRQRRHRYEMLGTISSGYDSITTATLCREFGMKQVVSFRSGRGGEQDHGEDAARILGLDLTLLDRRAWRHRDLAEVPFFVGDGKGQDVILLGAEELIRGRALVTGFHGGGAWVKHEEPPGRGIVRADTSGLGFCEYRLIVGCMHLPIAFLGSRQMDDIDAISRSPELAAWDVPGDYSRPICRRIVEEAGVPRAMFGAKKKAVTSIFGHGETLLTETTRAEYHRWLRKYEGSGNGHSEGKPKAPARLLLALNSRFYVLLRLVRLLTSCLPHRAGERVRRRLLAIQRKLDVRVDLVRHIFPWAVERLGQIYKREIVGREEGERDANAPAMTRRSRAGYGVQV